MFKKEAEEAANHYVSVFASVFGDSRIVKVFRFGKEELEVLRNVPGMTEDIMPGSAGDVSTVTFLLNGQRFITGNGGAYFGKFTESASIYVECDSQDQIDELWDKRRRAVRAAMQVAEGQIQVS
jgi:predicted 3-demethylubiquinone-9 3-methyltransferase (glyoxalase superfamily)